MIQTCLEFIHYTTCLVDRMSIHGSYIHKTFYLTLRQDHNFLVSHSDRRGGGIGITDKSLISSGTKRFLSALYRITIDYRKKKY